MRASAGMRAWQRRIFVSVWITYFAYYFCRYNMPVAKSSMSGAFAWNAADIGAVFTALTAMYAVGQFVNGQLGDRFGTRYISTLGCAGSVVMNLAVFALLMVAPDVRISNSSILLLLVVFWGINGFFQAMGWSPMVRVMAHWFPLQGRGKVMGWLGTCYQLGAACGSLLALFLVSTYVTRFNGDWRMVFFFPSILFAVVGVFFYMSLRDRPEDVGLPPVDAPNSANAGHASSPKPMAGEEAAADATGVGTPRQRTIRENIVATLSNRQIWLVAMVFFMLDVNRYGFVNWLPAYVVEAQQSATGGFGVGFLSQAMKIGIHPLAGSLGVVCCGWATDRFFQGRRAPVIAVSLLALGLLSIAFAGLDTGSTALVILVVALIGFFTYGAHILMVGHAAQDFGHKEGASGAAGFIDGMGYIGASLSGWGAGRLIDVTGYGFTFVMAGVCALVGAALICLLWNTKPQS